MAELSDSNGGLEDSLQCHLDVFRCHVRMLYRPVNISVAIIQWPKSFNGPGNSRHYFILLYVGYLIMQVMGGFLADRFGGKIVLGLGVLIWSFFTVVTPWQRSPA